jgi:glycosyltransferase involved in cell wall biosynthesis
MVEQNIRPKILFVGRNILKSGGKRGTDSFFMDLFAKTSVNENFDFLGLSADDEINNSGKKEESQIIRVPSSLLPKGTDKSRYYTDLWTGKIKRSLAKKIFDKNLDSLKVGIELKKLLKHVKIIHWLGSFMPLMNIILPLSRVYKVKNIISLMSYYQRYPLNDRLLKFSLNRFDRIIVNSESLGDAMTGDVGVSAEKIQFIPTGVDLDLYKPASDKAGLKKSKGIDPSTKVISWFGPIENCEYQDYLHLLDHAKSHSSRSELYIFAFKDEIPPPSDAPSDTIRFYNKLDSIREILDITDLVVLPFSRKNWKVGLPLTILEALACGIPVISMKRKGIDEAVKNNYTGILVEKIDDIPLAIHSLLADEKAIIEMSQNAMNFAEENFNISKIAESYTKLWSELC